MIPSLSGEGTGVEVCRTGRDLLRHHPHLRLFPTQGEERWRRTAPNGSGSHPMASLKDLRNRIASVKGDAEDHQGDADGRRRQACGAPRMPLRMPVPMLAEDVPSCSCEPRREPRRRCPGTDSAPRLMTGTGARPEVHLLVVCTADRGLCGGFNSAKSCVLAREHIRTLTRRRQDGEDRHASARRATTSCVAKYLRPDYREPSTCAASQAGRITSLLTEIAQEASSRVFDDGEFDVGDAVLLASSSSVISPGADRPKAHPSRAAPAVAKAVRSIRMRRSMSSSRDEEARSSTRSPAAQPHRPGVPRAFLENVAASEHGRTK